MEIIHSKESQGEMSNPTRKALLALVATKFSALKDITLGDEEIWFQVDRTSNPGQEWRHSDGIGIDMRDEVDIKIVGVGVKKYNSYESKSPPSLVNLIYRPKENVPQARYVLKEIHQRLVALLNKFYEVESTKVNEETSLNDESSLMTEQLIYDFSASLRKGHLTEARVKEELDDDNIMRLRGRFNIKSHDILISYSQYKDLIQFHIMFTLGERNSVIVKIPLEKGDKIALSSSEISCSNSLNAISDPELKAKILKDLSYFLNIATTQREEQLAWEKSIFDLREALKDSLERSELGRIGSKRSRSF